LLTDLAETPVEPIQPHYMRVGIPDGALGREFGEAWAPEKAWLLEAMLLENRRFLRRYVPAVLADMELHQTLAGLDCNEALRQTAGLSYPEMVELAQKADFRHTLWQIGEAVADMLASVVQREPRLARVPADHASSWKELTRRAGIGGTDRAKRTRFGGESCERNPIPAGPDGTVHQGGQLCKTKPFCLGSEEDDVPGGGEV
jgi:hypothetical protein